MNTGLQKYFPMIRTREEVLAEIQSKPELFAVFQGWKEEHQDEFLDCVTGVKGVKVLYDAFFKEIMNPENAPERLEEFLSLLLGEPVKIKCVLPTDNSRIADESSLLIMDILIELENGSLANLEAQKVGYMEHILIPLDIFLLNLQNKGINNELDAWLTFLSVDEPEIIEQLIKKYPQFKPMYHQIYEICRNTERVMGLYSEELRILDRNTVQLMIDEMQDEIDGQKKVLIQQSEQLSQQNEQLSQQSEQLSQQNEQLLQKDEQLSQKNWQIEQQLQEIARLRMQLAEKF